MINLVLGAVSQRVVFPADRSSVRLESKFVLSARHTLHARYTVSQDALLPQVISVATDSLEVELFICKFTLNPAGSVS